MDQHGLVLLARRSETLHRFVGALEQKRIVQLIEPWTKESFGRLVVGITAHE
jgi:hypothetical protein